MHPFFSFLPSFTHWAHRSFRSLSLNTHPRVLYILNLISYRHVAMPSCLCLVLLFVLLPPVHLQSRVLSFSGPSFHINPSDTCQQPLAGLFGGFARHTRLLHRVPSHRMASHCISWTSIPSFDSLASSARYLQQSANHPHSRCPSRFSICHGTYPITEERATRNNCRRGGLWEKSFNETSSPSTFPPLRIIATTPARFIPEFVSGFSPFRCNISRRMHQS